jgi:hypothetical protein
MPHPKRKPAARRRFADPDPVPGQTHQVPRSLRSRPSPPKSYRETLDSMGTRWRIPDKQYLRAVQRQIQSAAHEQYRGDRAIQGKPSPSRPSRPATPSRAARRGRLTSPPTRRSSPGRTAFTNGVNGKRKRN